MRALSAVPALFVLLTSGCCKQDEEVPAPSGPSQPSLSGWVRIDEQGQGVSDFAFHGDTVIMVGRWGDVTRAPAMGGRAEEWELAPQAYGETDWASIEVTGEGVFLVSNAMELYRWREGEPALSKVEFPEGSGFPGPWIRALKGGWLATVRAGDSLLDWAGLSVWHPATNQVSLLYGTSDDLSSDARALGEILTGLRDGMVPDRDGVLWFGRQGTLSMFDPSGESGLPESLPVLRARDYSNMWAPAAHPEGGMVLPFVLDPGNAKTGLVHVQPGGTMTMLMTAAPLGAKRTRIRDGYVYVASAEAEPEGLFRTKDRVLPAGTGSEPQP